MPTEHVQIHASIDTADLASSITFYRALLGAGPSVERHDYARFDVSAPPLVLGLNAVERPAAAALRSALGHLGIRFADDAALDAARERLVRIGIAVEDEPDAECCYARLARAWATDPSGMPWELFVTREALVDAPSRSGSSPACCEPSCCARIEA